jgi:hypothetical protein
MRVSRMALFVAGVLVLCGSAATAIAGDIYDDSGVLRPEFGDFTAAEKDFQNPPQLTPAEPDAWGLVNWSSYNIAAGDVRPRSGSQLNFNGTDYYIYSTGVNHFFDASWHVPTGASVTGVTPWYYDNDPAANFWFWMYDTHAISGSASNVQIHTFQSTGTPGYDAVYMPFAAPVTVLNYDLGTSGAHFYNVLVRVSLAGGSSVRFGGFNVWYLRQISPAPGSATFGDVPLGAFGFQHVEALNASGITAGCGGGNFCPNDPLTRVQMAIFLAKALGLHWPDS